MELFSTLDNALSQKAEETLNQFASRQKSRRCADSATQLGNPDAQIDTDVIGAFAVSRSSCFAACTVRAFGAEMTARAQLRLMFLSLRRLRNFIRH